MKSEKVKAAIERYRHTFAGFARPEEIAGYSRLFAEAAEMAEEEAEERVRAELTRWHDPKEEMPQPKNRDEDYRLLIKHRNGEIRLGFYRARTDSWWDSGVTGNFLIDEDFISTIRWREIHE